MVIICDIIQQQLQLPVGRIYFAFQEFKMPKDSGLFVILQYANGTPYSTTKRIINTSNGLQEELTIYSKDSYILSLLSKDDSARQNKEKAALALKSTFAQQQAEKYAFKIGAVANTIRQASFAEEPAMLNRYDIDFNVLTWQSVTNDIPYYDKFDYSVNVN